MATKMKLVPAGWTAGQSNRTPEGATQQTLVKELGEKYAPDISEILKMMASNGITVVDGRIKYADGVQGSSVVDMFKYILYPSSKSVLRPLDSEHFIQKLPSLALDVRASPDASVDSGKEFNKDYQHKEKAWITLS